MTKAACLLALVLVLPCVLQGVPVSSADEDGKPKSEPSALTVFREEARGLVDAWRGILRDTEAERKQLEKKRALVRAAERKGDADWESDWALTGDTRLKLHNLIFPHVLRWAPPLMALFAAHEGQALTPRMLAQVAKITADRVRAWVEVGEPGTLRGLIEVAPGGVPRALALPGRPHPRRALLAAVAARAAATPGSTDLKALLAVLSWELVFFGDYKPTAQLDAISRDLIVLFTERGEDGISKNDGSYYRPGRLLDRGFQDRYRDGGDQVRHFTWAFRMFVLSKDPESTEKLLRLKEQGDARSRKQPLNEKDLALNRAARDLVTEIRGSAERGMDAAHWHKLFEGRLGR